MHLRSSLSLLIWIFLINYHSSVDAIYCKKDRECPKGHYPFCTLPICIDKECGIVIPCHPQLNGNCTNDGDCPSNDLCKDCKKYEAPKCTRGKCIQHQCALIEPCTVRLDH